MNNTPLIITSSISALATVLMAFATWSLAKATKKMAESTKESILQSQQHHNQLIQAMDNLQKTIATPGN